MLIYRSTLIQGIGLFSAQTSKIKKKTLEIKERLLDKGNENN